MWALGVASGYCAWLDPPISHRAQEAICLLCLIRTSFTIVPSKIKSDACSVAEAHSSDHGARSRADVYQHRLGNLIRLDREFCRVAHSAWITRALSWLVLLIVIARAREEFAEFLSSAQPQGADWRDQANKALCCSPAMACSSGHRDFEIMCHVHRRWHFHAPRLVYE